MSFSLAAAAYSLPQEDEIDLASLLITGPIDPSNKRSYNIGGIASPSFNASRIHSGSPKRRSSPAKHAGESPFPARHPAERVGASVDSRRTPPASRGLFENSSDVGSVRSAVPLSAASPSLGGATRGPPPEPSAGSAELFACRESILVAADLSKSISDAIFKLERSVDRDGVFDENAVLSSYPQEFNCRSIAGSPKECKVLRESLLELADRANKLLLGLARNQDTANKTYHSQLKKMREVCNQSIRSALQADRAQTGAHLTQMKALMETERDRSLADIQRELSEHHRTATSLKEEVQRLHHLAEDKEAERELERRRGEDRLEEVEAVHRQALRAQQTALGRDLERAEERASEEIKKTAAVHEEARKQLVAECEKNMQQLRAHDAEIRDMLNSEIDRLKAECTRCRDQMMEISAQASTERDKLIRRFDDEKNIMETNFQNVQAESVQALARIRGEVADRVRGMQADEKRRQDSFEAAVQQERGDLIGNHILEVEELEDKHRKAIRRLEAQLEVRHSEELTKLRKVHEQEVRRLITDNDRLHRSMLAKSKVVGVSSMGGVQHLMSDLDASNALSRRAMSRAYTPPIAGGPTPKSTFPASLHTTPNLISAERGFRDSKFSISDMEISRGVERDSNQSGRGAGFSSPARTREESPPPPPPKSPLAPDNGTPLKTVDHKLTNPTLNDSSFLTDHSPTTPFASLHQKDTSEEYGYSDDSSVDPDVQEVAQNKGEKINWGSLQDSLDIQEGRLKSPIRSDKKMPNSFVLEEALQNSKYSGHNVTTAANAVGSYMNRLQSYLEGSDAGDTLSDSSAQRHLNAASDTFFGKYRVTDGDGGGYINANNVSMSSEDSLQ